MKAKPSSGQRLASHFARHGILANKQLCGHMHRSLRQESVCLFFRYLHPPGEIMRRTYPVGTIPLCNAVHTTVKAFS